MKTITTADGVEIDVEEPIGFNLIDGIAPNGELYLLLTFAHDDGGHHGYQLSAATAMDLTQQVIAFGRDHSDPDDA